MALIMFTDGLLGAGRQFATSTTSARVILRTGFNKIGVVSDAAFHFAFGTVAVLALKYNGASPDIGGPYVPADTYVALRIPDGATHFAAITDAGTGTMHVTAIEDAGARP